MPLPHYATQGLQPKLVGVRSEIFSGNGRNLQSSDPITKLRFPIGRPTERLRRTLLSILTTSLNSHRNHQSSVENYFRR